MHIDQITFIKKLIPSINNCSWFLGAGTSASANLPTAGDIIWDLKKQYYCLHENQDIKNQDIQILHIKSKIQSYIDSKGFPAEYSEEEYAFYFQLMFGNNQEAQRRYLVDALSSKKIALSKGHRALAALMSDGTTKVVYTTNFDKVVENAYSYVCGKDLGSYHLEGSKSCTPAYNNNEFPLYAKIHGDFQYQKLSNLEGDLRKADEEIQKCFTASSTRFGTVVAGYSGRDKCVMDLFNATLDIPNAFPHGLYWTVLKNSVVHPRVEQLITSANNKGVQAYIVEVDSFDSLMSQLWKNLPNRSKDLDAKVQRTSEREVIIPMPQQSKSGDFIRFNALPLTNLPDQCYKIESNNKLTWKDLKIIQKDSRGKLICWIDEDVCAWGAKDEIQERFPSDSIISIKDISQQVSDLKSHKALHSALEELICMSITNDETLMTRKNSIFLSKDHFQSIKFQKLKQCVNQVGGNLSQTVITDDNEEEKTVTPIWSWSIKIILKQANKNYFIILSPDIRISPIRVRGNYKDFLNEKRQLLKNDNMDRLFSAWIETIFPNIGRANSVSIKPVLSTGEKEFNMLTTTRTAYSRRAS